MQETELEESVMDESEIDRRSFAWPIRFLNRTKGARDLALVGIVTRGDILAHRLAKLIEGIEGTQPLARSTSASIAMIPFSTSRRLSKGTDILFSLDGKTIVLVTTC